MRSTSVKPLALFTLAAMAPWIGAATWVLIANRSPSQLSLWGDQPVAFPYLLMLLGIPAVTHWLIADLIDHRRPRLFLMGKARSWLAPATRGFVTGLLALASAAVFAPFLEPRFHGAWNIVACSLFWTAFMMLISAKARANHCASCDYDLSQTPIAAKCPECGRAFSRVPFTTTSAPESSPPPFSVPLSIADHQ